jgi:hypothetical protein
MVMVAAIAWHYWCGIVSSVTHMCIGRAPKVRLGGCHRARAGLTNHCQSSIAKNVRTKKFLILFAKIFIIFTADQKP